jgi:hypothetical protein
LEAEILIYDLEINKAFCLNPSAAIVWKHCNGKSTFAEVINDFNETFSQKITESFVWLTLESLKKENLLMNRDEVEPRFNGMSRREVIRKVGLASMVALPLISSIIAPKALMAQSTGLLPLLSPCSAPSQCASGSCINTAISSILPLSVSPTGPNCCALSAFPGAFLPGSSYSDDGSGCFPFSSCCSGMGINGIPPDCFC